MRDCVIGTEREVQQGIDAFAWRFETVHPHQVVRHDANQKRQDAPQVIVKLELALSSPASAGEARPSSTHLRYGDPIIYFLCSQ